MRNTIRPELKEKALKLYQQGIEKELIAERFGIRTGTLSEWIKNGIPDVHRVEKR